MKQYVIRKMEEGEIPLVAYFPPGIWNFDFSRFLHEVFHMPGFQAFVMHRPGGPVEGVGQMIRNGTTAWLGNIIVAEEFRGKGLGTALTRRLVEECRNSGVKDIHLIATAQGESIYRKLGFRVICQYLCFGECRKRSKIDTGNAEILPLEAKDLQRVEKIDRIATGEDRSLFLASHVPGGYGFFSGGGLEGYFLPSWENGPVIASGETAGLSLLSFKINHFPNPVVIPDSNRVAIEFLESSGCELRWKLPRMFLGGSGSWHASMIFSRASGYCG